MPGLLLAILFTLPLLVTVFAGVTSDFITFITEPSAVAALKLSAVTTLCTLIITLVLGTPLAYYISTHQFKARWLVETVVDLPIVLPPAVAGLALLMTFGRRGALGPFFAQLGLSLPFTTAAVVIAQVFVSAPFFVRAARIGFSSIDAHLAECAISEGANAWQLFAQIMLPLARRSLITGIILTGTRALGEFGATILFAGNLEGVSQTVPLAIYIGIERNSSSALALAVVLIALSGLLMAGLRRLEGHSP